jgi:YidC/Oxa1 family membrane protein insertase
MNENRNLIIAVVLTVAILTLYQIFFFAPEAERRQAELERQAEIAAETAPAQPVDTSGPIPVGQLSAPAGSLSREDAIERTDRIIIDTPSLSGSLSLTGARLDDLRLLNYDDELNSDTPINLLNPRETQEGYYARDGWKSSNGSITDLPGRDTPWTLLSGDRLTPTSPVVIGYETESGIIIRRTVSVDENYLFTMVDEVTNNTGGEVMLTREGLVSRNAAPQERTNNLAVFEGGIGVVGTRRIQRKYDKLDDSISRQGQGGWVGITDRYWLTAVAPDQSIPFTADIGLSPSGLLQMDYEQAVPPIPNGVTVSSTAYIFAGAKRLDVLQEYQSTPGIQRLDMAINWGWLWFLTRPFVWLLNLLAGMTGNFGVAIMILTLMVKIVLFPLANRSYASMAKMKLVQPKMKQIQERWKDDRQKQQQEMMELYRREKINPLAGCVPLLPQIPIFFALYQTLYISLEMRHAPFFGWIQDMASRDPTNVFNLFGLLPYDPTNWPVIGVDAFLGFLAIGIWPLIMGITMAAQQALNPPPTDATQARIFAFLPIVFTFVLAGFPAGLVIYWAWNNALSVGQQYIIMRRNGNETQLDKLIARLRNRGSSDGGGES